jgi:hypothetical protein
MQCEHEGCGCEAGQNERYCGEHCRRAGSSGSAAAQSSTGGCGCGHPGCQD